VYWFSIGTWYLGTLFGWTVKCHWIASSPDESIFLSTSDVWSAPGRRLPPARSQVGVSTGCTIRANQAIPGKVTPLGPWPSFALPNQSGRAWSWTVIARFPTSGCCNRQPSTDEMHRVGGTGTRMEYPTIRLPKYRRTQLSSHELPNYGMPSDFPQQNYISWGYRVALDGHRLRKHVRKPRSEVMQLGLASMILDLYPIAECKWSHITPSRTSLCSCAQGCRLRRGMETVCPELVL
jgi:hypothetical protein